jgi:hypothetical protein
MTPWFLLALAVAAAGAFRVVWWLSRSAERRDAEEQAERALAQRPGVDVAWCRGLNPQKAADQAEAGETPAGEVPA